MTDTVDRVVLAVTIISAIGTLVTGIPTSRRVIIAWTTWVTLRWRWRHARPSRRRWLWIVTVRFANGQDTEKWLPERGRWI